MSSIDRGLTDQDTNEHAVLSNLKVPRPCGACQLSSGFVAAVVQRLRGAFAGILKGVGLLAPRLFFAVLAMDNDVLVQQSKPNLFPGYVHPA